MERKNERATANSDDLTLTWLRRLKPSCDTVRGLIPVLLFRPLSLATVFELAIKELVYSR